MWNISSVCNVYVSSRHRLVYWHVIRQYIVSLTACRDNVVLKNVSCTTLVLSFDPLSPCCAMATPFGKIAYFVPQLRPFLPIQNVWDLVTFPPDILACHKKIQSQCNSHCGVMWHSRCRLCVTLAALFGPT